METTTAGKGYVELQSRLNKVEIYNKLMNDGVGGLRSLADIAGGVSLPADWTLLFRTAQARLRSFMPFRLIGFYTIDEALSIFSLVYCDPPHDPSLLDQEVQASIDDGTFAWALRHINVTLLHTGNGKSTLVLHPLTWAGQTVGMMAGTVDGTEVRIVDFSCSLLTSICYLVAASLNGSMDRPAATSPAGQA
jgi:two-component system, sensor histidine kinase